jgi:hypothetical protein
VEKCSAVLYPIYLVRVNARLGVYHVPNDPTKMDVSGPTGFCSHLKAISQGGDRGQILASR